MNILITSAGRRSYLIKYFKNSLGNKGRVFAANSEYTIALQEADEYFISPLIYDSGYVDSLITYCKENDIKGMISVFDIDLLVLSKAKEQIEANGIKLFLSNSQVVELCNDKWKTYEFLRENSLKTPLTFKSYDDLKIALEQGGISYPIVIKPRWGMASLGLYIAEDREELDFFYKKSMKDVHTSYLKYESSITPDETIIFQEKLIGQEYGLDVMSDLDGNYISVFPKSKLQMRAGETDLGQTVSPLKFEYLAKEITRLLRHEVIMSVDCFEKDGDLYVIEMNCRISGHYPLSHLAGANLPKQLIEWLEGLPTNLNNYMFTEGLYITKDLNPIILSKP